MRATAQLNNTSTATATATATALSTSASASAGASTGSDPSPVTATLAFGCLGLGIDYDQALRDYYRREQSKPAFMTRSGTKRINRTLNAEIMSADAPPVLSTQNSSNSSR